MKIWRKYFIATYTLDNGVIVIDDKDVPFPKNFKEKPELRSSIIFPPQTRAGDHFHSKREEVFIGFGEGMQIIFEDPKTKKAYVFNMDPSKNNGKCTVFLSEKNIPHAVRNVSDNPGFLIEFASHQQEKTDYKLAVE